MVVSIAALIKLDCCEFRLLGRPHYGASASESLHQGLLCFLLLSAVVVTAEDLLGSGSERLPISKNKNAEQMPSCRVHLPASLFEVFSQAHNLLLSFSNVSALEDLTSQSLVAPFQTLLVLSL